MTAPAPLAPIPPHYGCFECSASFDTEAQLRTHMFDHHLSIKTTIAVQASCGHRFADMDHLNHHKCDGGPVVLADEASAANHTDHFGCFGCGGAFATESAWRHHMLYSHNTAVKFVTRVGCKCGESFRSGYHLRRHVEREGDGHGAL